jgi:hypothetical protein
LTVAPAWLKEGEFTRKSAGVEHGLGHVVERCNLLGRERQIKHSDLLYVWIRQTVRQIFRPHALEVKQ